MDTSKLALHYGTNVNIEDPAENKARKEFDEQKTYLISAYSRMARAQLDLKDDAGFSGTLKVEANRSFILRLLSLRCLKRVVTDLLYAGTLGRSSNVGMLSRPTHIAPFESPQTQQKDYTVLCSRQQKTRFAKTLRLLIRLHMMRRSLRYRHSGGSTLLDRQRRGTLPTDQPTMQSGERLGHHSRTQSLSGLLPG